MMHSVFDWLYRSSARQRASGTRRTSKPRRSSLLQLLVAAARRCHTGRLAGLVVIGASLCALMVPLAPAGKFDAAPATDSDRDQMPPSNQARLKENFARTPLSFEATESQSAGPVKFLSRGNGYTLFLTSEEAVLSLQTSTASISDEVISTTGGLARAVIHMQLVGASPATQVVGRDELPGKINYFLGNDPTQWRTNISTYARVEYQQVYPGINLVYYGNQRQLEYDFVVAPGADPRTIALRFGGTDKVTIDDQGDLVLHTEAQQIHQHKPFIYQEENGIRKEVSGAYVLEDQQQVSFRVGAYDTARPLVIDPVLSYSTFLGGSGMEEGIGIAVDSTGSAYATGYTASDGFPLVNPLQSARGGGLAAFVTKLSPDGTAIVYSTFLGGSGFERSAHVAVDSEGSAYVTGFTNSHDYPTTPGAFQTNFGSGNQHAFVTKWNATGSALVYSTYLGGSGDEGVVGAVSFSIAIDLAGNAYIRGNTNSVDFPTTPGAFQTTYGGGFRDAFVTKLNPTGSALVYSTYLGGSGEDRAQGLAVDAAGYAYVSGFTTSPDFPTTPGAFETQYRGNVAAFVAKLNPDGTDLVYSTYIASSAEVMSWGIAIDAAGNAYVTGNTSATDFPTTDGAFQRNYGGNGDAFVTKLNSDGSALVYSTYLGGADNDQGLDIAVDAAGSAYVTGGTSSTNFPTANPIQAQFGGGGARSNTDAFVTKVNEDGTALAYSTYLGGKLDDLGLGIAVDNAGNAFIIGWTYSDNFPTVNPVQPVLGGMDDAIVVKISDN